MPRPAIERHGRQQDIVDVARGVFIAKGIEKSTMEDIARAAKLTRRTLYAYFKSRDEVCLMVLVADNRARWTTQKEAVATGGDGLNRIKIWCRSLWDYSRDHPHSMRLQIWWDLHGIDRNLISDDLFGRFETLNDELADGLREIFHLGIADGSVRPEIQVDLTISHLLQSVRAVIHRALSPQYSFSQFDPDEYVEQYIDLLIRAIGNPGR